MENNFEDTTGAVPSQFIKDSTTGEEDPAQDGCSLPMIRLQIEDIHEVSTGMQSVV